MFANDDVCFYLKRSEGTSIHSISNDNTIIAAKVYSIMGNLIYETKGDFNYNELNLDKGIYLIQRIDSSGLQNVEKIQIR